VKSHQNNTKTFDELDYAEQAKSISASVLSLEHLLLAHKKRAEEEKRDSPLQMNIEQIRNMLKRLE
jgi:hypothetical protein